MEEEILYDMLNSFYVDELKELGQIMGLDSVNINKKPLIEKIIHFKKHESLSYILEYMNRDSLISICEYFSLHHSKKNMQEMKAEIKEHIKLEVKNYVKPLINFTENKINDINDSKTSQTKNNSTKEYDISKANLKKYEIIESVINNWEISRTIFDKNKDEDMYKGWLHEKLRKEIGGASSKFHLGKYNDLLIDIDISKGFYGIELKMSKKLYSTHELTRAIGQAYLYSTELYKDNNFLFVVIGNTDENNEEKIKDFEKIVKKFNGRFIYKTI